MASKPLNYEHEGEVPDEDEDEDMAEQIYGWDEWNDDEEPEFHCLFCDLKWTSAPVLFEHCNLNHAFDFFDIRKSLGLDFHESIKLINYVRSQVSSNKCWICGLAFTSKELLQKHLHETSPFEKGVRLPWQSEDYLQPFMKDDALLHSFAADDDSDDDIQLAVDREELMREVADVEALVECLVEDRNGLAQRCNGVDNSFDGAESSSGLIDVAVHRKENLVSTVDEDAICECPPISEEQKGKINNISFANVAAREIKSVNEKYFGSYGYYDIHREMLSDKVRMDAYREAILCNPSLFHQATVMDIGCGTCILSLFAAQAGASLVIAVEASDNIAAKAKQIARDNGMLKEETRNKNPGQNSGVIKVVQGMVEDLRQLQMPQNSVDVLLSEWMGYCLLYESMLSSVLIARDKWLKPGGAILPDIATLYVAGFGRGGTSHPFWENVYGFNMSCIAEDVAQDASQHPIIDTVNTKDLVTDSVVLHKFDLMTMKPDEMDFTACFELGARVAQPESAEEATTKCYGLVLWFDTGFTNRFCKEKSSNLSTSPYTPKTHWYQTLLTFKEPVTMSTSVSPAAVASSMSTVGADASPAVKIWSRISIARAARHRSIDISVETKAIGSDGWYHVRPVQIFNL